MVFLEQFSKYLLFFHLLSTGVLIGALTHTLIVIVGYWRGRFGKRKLEKLYSKVGFWPTSAYSYSGLWFIPPSESACATSILTSRYLRRRACLRCGSTGRQ